MSFSSCYFNIKFGFLIHNSCLTSLKICIFSKFRAMFFLGNRGILLIFSLQSYEVILTQPFIFLILIIVSSMVPVIPYYLILNTKSLTFLVPRVSVHSSGLYSSVVLCIALLTSWRWLITQNIWKLPSLDYWQVTISF